MMTETARKAENSEDHFGIEYVLKKMVRASERARDLDEGIAKCGYPTSPFGCIYGEIADAIYCLIGENTIHFEDSLTFIVLNTNAITDEAKTSILLKKYIETHNA